MVRRANLWLRWLAAQIRGIWAAALPAADALQMTTLGQPRILELEARSAEFAAECRAVEDALEVVRAQRDAALARVAELESNLRDLAGCTTLARR